METEKWHEFMKNSDYKRYQITLNRNRPYLDEFQKDLMEKYQLHYFKMHPLEDELNRKHIKLIFKLKR
jgi:hypothetical protein